MSVSTQSVERAHRLEIDVGKRVYNVTFTANGEHLVTSSEDGVQVWRVKDGQQAATIPVQFGAYPVTASRDGRYIAAGSVNGGFIFVWSATTYREVLADWVGSDIRDVDFSTDSTCLIYADFDFDTATIWDIAAREKVQSFGHRSVLVAKYSPRGDQVATASPQSIRVWDLKNGQLVINVEVGLVACHDLLWHNNYLFVIAEDGKIRQIDTSAGSTISDWAVFGTDYPLTCFALPQHGTFIACSADKTLNFFHTATRSQLDHTQHTSEIRSMICSFDDQLLAIVTGHKIVVDNLPPAIHRFVPDPGIDIDVIALNTWKHGPLEDVEELLSAAIPTAQNNAHHLLASRALVRARLGHWDAALVDAEKSIEVQRSLLGYVAKYVILVHKGEKDEGIRAYDIAFEHFHSKYVTLLLLIKAVVIFMTGDHADALSRMDDLVTAHKRVDPVLYRVKAYMHFLQGNKYMDSNDYENAIQSFEAARIELDKRARQPPLIVLLIYGWCFDGLAIKINRRLCEAFFSAGRSEEAGVSVLRMVDQGINMSEPDKMWVSEFKHHCRKELENLGNNAMKVKNYGEAVSQYTVALLLDPVTPQELLVKRSRAYVAKRMWEDALNDAHEAIKLDPSSPSGYQEKYITLLGMGHQDDATVAFEMMLSKMSESSDLKIRERSLRYVQTRDVIRNAVKNAVLDSPSVLINTLSGRLCNKTEQAAAFESTVAFSKLIASMTTHIDHAQIKQVVGTFYRYATFSHTWEGREPPYEMVVKTVVYDLEAFPTHNKLRMFCEIVRDDGFNWAWSDTCCINKADQFALQEALVSMFKWYEGSSMTIIFLCDVGRLEKLDALMRSLWNSRGWTLQEYHASKVVRIYTKDWTPYLGLTIYNHKESPEIIAEMERATGISAESLIALRPGPNSIREKLRLASTRQTTRVEDAAYSLLGIFSMTLPVTYGEGDKALGRLLSQLLTSSGDTSILAWIGRSGSFNSCLPTEIGVFNQPLASHIPPAIPDTDMATFTDALHASSLDSQLVTRLYDQLNMLPLPLFVTQRMKLPCLAFKIRSISLLRNGVFWAQVGGLSSVEIRARQNISGEDSLYLVHPWIDFLLDRHAIRNIVDIPPDQHEPLEFDEFPPSDQLQDDSSTACVDLPDDAESLPSPTVPLMDVQTKFLARLRQPFGALLLAPTRRNVPEYRRIATENVIMARVKEITSMTLNKLSNSVRVLDVL